VVRPASESSDVAGSNLCYRLGQKLSFGSVGHVKNQGSQDESHVLGVDPGSLVGSLKGKQDIQNVDKWGVKNSLAQRKNNRESLKGDIGLQGQGN